MPRAPRPLCLTPLPCARLARSSRCLAVEQLNSSASLREVTLRLMADDPPALRALTQSSPYQFSRAALKAAIAADDLDRVELSADGSSVRATPSHRVAAAMDTAGAPAATLAAGDGAGASADTDAIDRLLAASDEPEPGSTPPLSPAANQSAWASASAMGAPTSE